MLGVRARSRARRARRRPTPVERGADPVGVARLGGGVDEHGVALEETGRRTAGIEEVGPFAAAMPWKCAEFVPGGRSPRTWVDTPGMDPASWYDEIHHIHGFRRDNSPDEAIAVVAARLGGVIDRAQLAVLGVERGAVEHRIRVGRLRPLYRGVYAVGHDAVSPRGRLVAGLLAAGPGAALSHRTAARLWKLTLFMPQFVEITTTNRSRRSRNGLILHETQELNVTLRHDLPVTTPIRSLLDLAATRPRDEVERACSEALVLGLTTAEELTRQHGRGAAVLARITGDGIAPTRSELERRFLKAVLKARLPRPEVNTRIGRHRVDFLWRDRRLVVELDGWRFHGHRLAFERDRVRDVELQLAGYTVVRFTWRQLRDEPTTVMTSIAGFLSPPASRRAS